MSVFLPKHWLFKINKPEDLDILRHVGRSVRVEDPDTKKEVVVEIEEIKGSLRYPTKFQITAKDKWYLISMLDFFAQMNGEKISSEEVALFDATTFEIKESSNWWRMNRGRLWVPRKGPKLVQ